MSGVIRKLPIHLCFCIIQDNIRDTSKKYIIVGNQKYIFVLMQLSLASHKRGCVTGFMQKRPGKRLQHTFMQNKLGELRRFVRKVDI